MKHKYVVHSTYTGPGCAICSKHELWHSEAVKNFAVSLTKVQAWLFSLASGQVCRFAILMAMVIATGYGESPKHKSEFIGNITQRDIRREYGPPTRYDWYVWSENQRPKVDYPIGGTDGVTLTEEPSEGWQLKPYRHTSIFSKPKAVKRCH